MPGRPRNNHFGPVFHGVNWFSSFSPNAWQSVCMEPQQAYLLGRACMNVAQAGRLLGRRLSQQERNAAWFALGFWSVGEASESLLDDTLMAVREHLAFISYESPDQPASEAWAEWLLYAPVVELKRRC